MWGQDCSQREMRSYGSRGPGNSSLGPSFSSGPGQGLEPMSITMCSEALPSPLPLEETVTLLRPVTETMAGSTPPSLILHQDVGKKPRRLFFRETLLAAFQPQGHLGDAKAECSLFSYSE